MKKIFLIFLIGLMALSLVFAAKGNAGTAGQQVAESVYTNSGSTSSGSNVTQVGQVGQGTNNGIQTNEELKTQNQGENVQLQNKVQTKVQSGYYEDSNGERIQIQTGEGNEIKLKSGNVEAKTALVMTQERDQVQNKTQLKVQLSNGVNAEVKVMPNTASETALAKLGAKCEGNCTIELKEVGTGNQIKAVYEIKTQKQAKILGLFKAQMQVQAQVDAETGEVVQAKKPWWAFLAF